LNELILKEVNLERVVYQYLPEGRGTPGEIEADRATGDVKVLERATEDDSGRYAHNAARRITEYMQKKNLPMQAIQAWY
jgi:hypothetical protein